MVKFPFCPGFRMRLEGFALMKKVELVPGMLMKRLACCSSKPLIPVIAMYTDDPWVAPGATKTVRSADADPPGERKMFVGFREIAAGPYDESVSPIRPLKPEMLFRLTETAAAVPGESVREVVLSDN